MEKQELNIELYQCINDGFDRVIDEVYRDEELINEFYMIRRIVKESVCFYEVRVNDETAGFAALTKEKNNNGTYFLYMGIIEKYRKQGIGNQVLKQLTEKNFDGDILVDADMDNTAGNKCIQKVGYYVTTIGTRNIYTLVEGNAKKYGSFENKKALVRHYQLSNGRIIN